MKKKLLSAILSVVMAVSILPTTALAAPAPNTSESEPVLLGTETEYAGALKTMFDENGLRIVQTGFNSNNGLLNRKVGLINKYGNFVVSPIYDDIRLYVANYDYVENGLATALPHYFLGGYTQAIRDGKMGLLNTNGEEVIPCQYDFVRLPSEGVCAVYDKNGKLGYWSIEKNREIVKPKYIPLADKMRYITYKKPTGDYLGVHDFIDGYALVSYKDKTVNMIDKNGKEILDKNYTLAPEVIRSLTTWEYYPQKGPYLAFNEKKDGSKIKLAWNEGGPKKYSLKYPEYYTTGLVGRDGVIIPATYTAGINTDMSGLKGNSGIMTTMFQIIPEENLIITGNAPKLDLLFEYGYGAIDLKGNVVIPFSSQVPVYYDQNAKVLKRDRSLFTTTGKRICDDSFYFDKFYNGYSIATKRDAKNKLRTTYISKPDGKLFNVSAFLKTKDKANVEVSISHASVGGYFWVKDANDKWGLIDFTGKVKLSFQYDQVNYDAWHTCENGYAKVTKSGKVGVVNAYGKVVTKCIYDSVAAISENGTAISLEQNNKFGLADLKTGKTILSAVYDYLGLTDINAINLDCFALGVCYAVKDGNHLLVDKKGKTLFSTKDKFTEANRDGLYCSDAMGGCFDTKGQLIIPNELYGSAHLEWGDTYTIYVKDGNVYRCSVNYIDHSYGYKTYVPGKTTSVASSTEFRVNGQYIALGKYEQEKYNTHAKAYEEAKKNPWKQTPILKEELIRFNSTPDTLEYYVGEPFDISGFDVTIMDVYGDHTDITSKIVLKVDSTKIYDGYKFQTASSKTVNCYYNGEKLNSFKINVYEKVNPAELPLDDGNYYMKLMGKYVVPVGIGDRLELSDKKSDQPFTLTHLSVNKETGYHIYSISINGRSVEINSKGELVGGGSNTSPYKWRIAKYTEFWTVRQENNQAMVVNASGESDKNGTKVIVWNHTGKAPEHAKIQFLKAD